MYPPEHWRVILNLFINKSTMTFFFDKGDAFPSSITKMAHLISNIKPKMFYADTGQKY